jgi:PPP family 3-phenylpropionic acid transporter
MTAAKSFYFIFYAALACFAPFLALYYQDAGLSGREIGFLAGIVPLITLFASSLWGMVSDATGRHRLLFLLSLAGTWLSVLLISQATSFVVLLPIVIVYAFCFAPIIPLVDNAVVEGLGVVRRNEYGQQRVWGSYGWGISGAIAGSVIAARGLNWSFILFLVIFLPLFLVGSRLPMSSGSAGGRFWSDLRQLLSNRPWLLFLATAVVGGISMSIFLNFLFLYLEELGFSTTIMGITMTLTTISEIPIFLYSRRLLARWSAPLLLAVSIAFTVVRSFAYIGMTEPWQVLIISLLHGPTFALMWAAGVAYAAESAPPGLGATAQGVFSGLAMGLGAALGAFAGGLLIDAYGMVSLFYFAGIAALIALVIFVTINRDLFRSQLQQSSVP